ncbi:HNH endonuclease [Erwinia endophytica]|uniref:HNH endonuclease n=1 Tax=Erwinia endophytica TaxID=1563158 RepID=UPI001265E5CF|nr:HNH endonuclease signature motif containing protein [Erwinia endophytica]KAB8313509.1 HNH endonuclease [Erwinia endophytica]
MKKATVIYKNIGYDIMQYLHESFVNSVLYNINEKGCYQKLELDNGCSIRFTKWNDGAMPFYIILFNPKGKYIFELDLSMIIYNNKFYDWHLKPPTNKTNFNVISKELGEITELPEKYINHVKDLKKIIHSGTKTPKNGFRFLSNFSWDSLTTKLLNLITSVFNGHKLLGLTTNSQFIETKEAPNDNIDEYQNQRRHPRKGQTQLKQRLLEVYDAVCCITGCSTLEVLEAAHILSHADSGVNDSENALLLRADIHILFDRNLLKISPRILKIYLDNSLKDTEYWNLNGKLLRKRNDGRRPSFEYLNIRWKNN